MTTVICAPDDLHTYDCGGKGKCIHCDRVNSESHDPLRCRLCDDDDGIDLEQWDDDEES